MIEDTIMGNTPLEGAGPPVTPDEPRAWALIGMSVFLGMRYAIWDKDMAPEKVADLAVDFVR